MIFGTFWKQSLIGTFFVFLVGCSLDASLIGEELPLLESSGEPLQFNVVKLEFGEGAVGTPISRTVTVFNRSAEIISEIQTWSLNSPFYFAGGIFPGVGGTCSEQLNPLQSCTLVIEFAASAPASFEDELMLKYLFKGENKSKTLQIQAAADSTVTAVDLKAGPMIFCARLSNNSLRCWGEGGYGDQLGNGVNYSMYDGVTTPITPLQMSSDVLDFDMTWGYSCAIKTGGQVWCWGSYTPSGPLNSPNLLLASGAEKISIGEATSGCAVVLGGVKCWGYDAYGGLVGDGGGTGSLLPPTDVVGLSGTFVDVAVAREAACALNSIGTVYCWGSNSSGALAKAGVMSSSSAVLTENMVAGLIDIEASSINSFCGLTSDHKVYCWGGSIGAVPTQVTGLSGGISNLRSILNSNNFCIAKDDNSGLYCWATSLPLVASQQNYGLSSISSYDVAGYTSTMCALTDGNVKCWGKNIYGLLGIGGASGKIPMASPATIPGLQNVERLTMGRVGMAVHADGSLSCWGDNSLGECGSGDLEPIGMAKKIFFSGVTRAKTNSSGKSCIIRNSQVLCSGSAYSQTFFAPLSPDLTQATDLDGAYHFCAVSNGAAYCWGWNNPTVLGASSCVGDCQLNPQAVQGMESGVTAVSVGYEHACGIKDGQVYCWGFSTSNQLGSVGGSTSVARLITGSPTDAIAISSGYSFSCAAKASGGVVCWGNGFGAPVVLSGTESLVASNLILAEYSKIFFSSGTQAYVYNGSLSTQATNWDYYEEFSIQGGTYYATCGIQSGAVKCFGSNIFGNLGLSNPSPATIKSVPFPVYNLF
nr:hypothetical protein [uncultured Bdellovibrio sp.]